MEVAVGDVPPGFGGAEPAFSALLLVFAVVGLLVLAGFLFVGYAMVRSARASRRAGVDPFTPEAAVVAQALRGGAPRPLEQRLAELDDLLRRGVISSDEHRAARAQALAAG